MAPLSHPFRRTGPRRARRASLGPLVVAVAALAGCDLLGVPSSAKTAAAREAEGRAIGGACRHAARAIEDCYAMNKKADKAAMFAGWRDMNDYMRENKMEPVAPQVAGSTPAAPKADAAGDAAGDDKRARKSADAAKPGGRASKAVDS